jgi:MOSC domain-containing protein YiiM
MAETAGGRVARISVNSQGGVPKHRVPAARLEIGGVVGDHQNDREHHGGPERAVCLYAAEVIRALQQEGHPIEYGAAGENLTLENVDWARIVPGARLRIGDGVLLEVVSYTTPCYKIAASFVDGDFKRISQKLHPGWSRVYARVLQPGEVREGDCVTIA